MVREVVEVDVDNQTEVIYVPQHNDVAAMEMMNDFKVVRSAEFMLGFSFPNERAEERMSEFGENDNDNDNERIRRE